jgi:hypothetical protein
LAVVFAFFGIVAVRSIANEVARAASHASIGAASTTKVLFLLVGYVVVFLGTLGLLTISLQQFFIGGALTGVIIGIAAQQPLTNLFAGLVLLIARPIAGPVGAGHEQPLSRSEILGFAVADPSSRDRPRHVHFVSRFPQQASRLEFHPFPDVWCT